MLLSIRGQVSPYHDQFGYWAGPLILPISHRVLFDVLFLI